MNKKTTREDVARLFPDADIKEKDGTFSLPLHKNPPCLRLVIPEELPVGSNATPLLPGEFHINNLPALCVALETEFPVWVAAGRYANTKGDPEFHFRDWKEATQLLLVTRWELIPPRRVAAGMESDFAKEYQAGALMRLTPPQMLGLNQVLPSLPAEAMPELDSESGMDFWVIDRMDFFELERKLLSEQLRQATVIGQREQDGDAAYVICKRMLEDLAREIANDAQLEGWKLECHDSEAFLTMKDQHGSVRGVKVLYTPTYVTGTQCHVKRGREGTLVF